MPTKASSSRARANARTEVLAMLEDDHKRVKKAFRDFQKLDPQSDQEECRQLVEMTCQDLEVHTMLEEELFYPAVRACLKEEDLIDEAEVEHGSAKALIAQLKELEPGDPKFAATFTVLGEYVKHHIGEEEKEVFPQLARARLDWDKLCDQMHDRRDALTEEQDLEPGSTGKQVARASA